MELAVAGVVRDADEDAKAAAATVRCGRRT
jgi:hypothetical protein